MQNMVLMLQAFVAGTRFVVQQAVNAHLRVELGSAWWDGLFSRERSQAMAKNPGIGKKVMATVMSVKGTCSAGHQVGECFEISCHDPGGLCGFFYHDIFPSLSTFQFGGNLPWWHGDTIEVCCPDAHNLVTMKLERSDR